MNQSEWQPLAVLAAAMLFIVVASLIQRLMARAAARQDAAERATARRAQPAPAPPRPPRTAAEPEPARPAAARSDPRPPARTAGRGQGPPAPEARRRVRRLLRAPGGRKAAVLLGEILGPPAGFPPLARVPMSAAAEAVFTAATILWILFAALSIHHLQLQGGATVGLAGQEGRILGKTVFGCAVSSVLGGLLAWWLSR